MLIWIIKISAALTMMSMLLAAFANILNEVLIFRIMFFTGACSLSVFVIYVLVALEQIVSAVFKEVEKAK